MSKDTLSGKVALCVQTLQEAMATSSGSSLRVFKEVVEMFNNFTLEVNKPDRPATSTGEHQLVGSPTAELLHNASEKKLDD